MQWGRGQSGHEEEEERGGEEEAQETERNATEQMGRSRRRIEWRTVRVGAEPLLGDIRLEAAAVRLGETLLLRAHALRLHQHRTAAFLQSAHRERVAIYKIFIRKVLYYCIRVLGVGDENKSDGACRVDVSRDRQ